MDPVSADIVAQSESPTTILRWFTVVGVQPQWSLTLKGAKTLLPAVAHVLSDDAESAAVLACRDDARLQVVAVFEGQHTDQLPSETAGRWTEDEESSDDAELGACDCDHVVLSETPTE